MYNKFLEGLPSQLQSKVMDERETPNANFVFAPLFAAPHPQAGAANPHAGEKDLRKVSAYFSRVWSNMISNGMVRIKAETAKHVDDASANWVGKGKGKGAKGKGGRGNAFGGRGNGSSSSEHGSNQQRR